MEPFVLKAGTGRPGLLHIAPWGGKFGHVRAGFSTRLGGVSAKPFFALNCGLHVGDDAEDVVRNRMLLSEAAGFAFSAWTNADQIHSDRVVRVTGTLKGRGRSGMEDAIPGTDALICDEPGIVLAALFADCVPLYFYDPNKNAVGLAHAGWKGTVLEIAKKTVEAMRRSFGSNPDDLRAAIGPSIGACCYEVDDKVAVRVREIRGAEFALQPKGEGKYWLDLKQLNRHIMIKAGIVPSRIEVSMLCTSCRTDLFFSHRAEAGKTGRMAAWIGIARR